MQVKHVLSGETRYFRELEQLMGYLERMRIPLTQFKGESMNIKLFTDLIDALGKVVNGIKVLVNIPKNERAKYHQIMDETYRLIDTTLNMVIIRLGDIQPIKVDNEFMDEVMKLNNYKEWCQAEREFRLCKSLRLTICEMKTVRSKLTGGISAKDWDALLDQMQSVLATEDEVARYVGDKFQELADFVQNGSSDPQLLNTVRKQIEAFRDALIKERQQLIQQEIELYTII